MPASANVTVPGYLEAVNIEAMARKWPLLSAIVVSKDHLKDGKMDEPTLTGFCKSAEKLGKQVGDRCGFLRLEQQAVFDSAAEGRLG